MLSTSIIPLVLSCLALAVSADRTESATSISFKDTIKLPGASSDASLAGLGVRVKKIGPVKAKVYALGIYVDEKAAVKDLDRYKDEDDLTKNDGFYRDAKTSAFEKTLVLKMARTVGTEKMVSALSESVKPRMSGGLSALSDFEAMLLAAVSKEGAAKKGLQFGFVCKDDSLCISINGKDTGTIKSAPLRTALLDVYLGKGEVSPGAKKDFAAGIKVRPQTMLLH
ncbi:unnamed protein product [Chrysoparadoxa australica]